MAARIEDDPRNSYVPPDLASLEYFGRGLTEEQARGLQRTETSLILDFAHSKEHVWSGMRSALDLTYKLARETDGLIWDEMTREVFTPVVWRERRMTSWDGPFPDVAKHTVIHAYQNDAGVRSITLGMAKFGMPDVVIEDSSWSSNRNIGHIINLFAQSIAEGAVIEREGEFDLNFRSIKTRGVREAQITTLKKNATSIALLTLKQGTPEEGDPENRLVEITFDRGVGPDIHARREHILGTAFGADDSITDAKHDEELIAASNRARKKLPGLRVTFNRGLKPGEYIQLKAPFTTPSGGQEWMWVEVTGWKGDRISGLLQNEPMRIPDLHVGQAVEISEREVFDYIETRADGTQHGNETGRLIESRSK